MPPSSALHPGQLIHDRYRIDRMLGEGGMGAVYLATDTRLDRQVALKIPFVAENDDEARKRFEREARIAAGLAHPNVCTVHDFGQVDGQPFLVMQLIEGVSLAQRVGPTHLWRAIDAVQLVQTLASTMEQVHQKGALHRDLKPSNIMLCLDRPVIMDFGLARPVVETTQLTSTGRSLGTPAYMSLEQFQGDATKIGPRTDVYSLGVILYELLTGTRPFVAASLPELCMKMVLEQAVAPSTRRAGLDSQLDVICLKAMAKEPKDRYPTMAAFAADLKDYLNSVQSTESLGVDQSASLPPANSPIPATCSVETTRPPSRDWSLAAAAGLAVIVLLVFAGLLILPYLEPAHDRGGDHGGEPFAQQQGAAGVVVQPDPVKLPDAVQKLAEKPKEEDPNVSVIKIPIDPPPTQQKPEPVAFKPVADTQPKSKEPLPAPRKTPEPLVAPFTAAEARESQQVWADELGIPVVQLNTIGMKLVLVPPGTFTMGSPEGEPGRVKDEIPHRVRLTRPLQVSATEVTQEEYQRVMQRNRSSFRGDRNPVESVDWFEAVAYCNELSKKEGLRPCYQLESIHEDQGRNRTASATRLVDGTGYRLLTEAEWEYACRAGATSPYAFGESLTAELANFAGSLSKQTKPVGSFAANAFGLHDFHGNVWEWCGDWYGSYDGDALDPVGPAAGSFRVIRGGSWNYSATSCRSAIRYRYGPMVRMNILGFRVARVPRGKDQ